MAVVISKSLGIQSSLASLSECSKLAQISSVIMYLSLVVLKWLPAETKSFGRLRSGKGYPFLAQMLSPWPLALGLKIG
jgi:hypothetical protein